MTFRTVYGNTYSENRWRMCNSDECDITRLPKLFLVDTAPLRKGAPLTILGAWLFWYDRNVEEILSPTWGWSNTNDVTNSNHLSGTAVDVNAPKYPWGQRVMPAARKQKIREGLALFEGTVFWGADWSRADEMHYQMAFREGDPRNEGFAAKLRAGHLGIYGGGTTVPTPSTPTPSTSRPTMRRGSIGSDVTYLQSLFNRAYPAYSKLAVDGDFGPATESVVREFQRRAGLGVDGVVGPATWSKLGVK